ncbi:MAG: hypothetical protein R2909_23140 [Gemmatimonadales bacterium]
MRFSYGNVQLAGLALAAGLVAACGKSEGGTGPGDNPAISISISKTSLTIQQGGSDDLVATITRSGGFSGVVNISTEGAPAGVTAAASNVTTNNGTTTGTITVAVGAAVAPGTYNLTVRASGSGVDPKTVSLTLTVTAAPAITVAVNPTSLSLAQGASGSAAVTLTRTNFTGAANLTLEGAPTGVTGTFNPAAPTGTTSTLDLQVAATTTPGSYSLTIRATGTGVTAVTATLQLTVTTVAAASFTLSAGTGASSVAQGGSGQRAIALTRTNFTGAVDLSLEGAPAGVGGSFNPAAPTGNTSTLTITVEASVAPGDYTLTVRGEATGLADQTATFTLTVTAVTQGAYTLGTTPAGPVNLLADGATVNVVVDIDRTGGFTGAVSLAVSGAPAGLTATLTPPSTTGNASTLSLSASGTAPLGNTQLTITGTATGLTDRTVGLTVNVSAGSGGGNVSLDYSACIADAKPIWLAVQNGTGAAWVAITPVGDVFTFNATQSKVGLAIVTAPSGIGTNVSVAYYSNAEIVAFGSAATCPPAPATKSLMATTANLGMTQLASIYLGRGSGFATSFQPTATLQGVENGTFDLTAYAATAGVVGGGDRAIIRRDINTAALGDGASIGAALDFTGAESFAPASALITIGGLGGGESILHSMSYQTRTSCETGLLYGGASAGMATSFTAYGVPAGQQRATDYHGLGIIALSAGNDYRTVTEYFQALGNRTVNLPSMVPTFSPSTLSGPYKRLRFQLTLPTDLNQAIVLGYSDAIGGQTVTLTATVAGFLGGSQVDLSLPDFTGVAGWNDSWAPASGATVEWSATASGSTTTSPCAGGRYVSSTRIGSS